MGTKTKNVIYVRWLIRKDMPAINEINIEASYQLLEEDITKMLRTRNVAGMVVELDGVVAGYMIYALEKGSIDLYHLVVDPVFHGQGLGTALIEKLKTKLGTYLHDCQRIRRTGTGVLSCRQVLLRRHHSRLGRERGRVFI